MALPVGSTPYHMVEVCSLPLQAMPTAPAPGMQRVYVAIKQLVALCSQIPLKCSIARPPKSSKALCATSTNQKAGS